MARYSNDPRWQIARFPGEDMNGRPFKKGERIFYYPSGKIILSGEAAEKAAAEFESARQDEEGF